MLNFIELSACVYKRLRLHSVQGRDVYMTLYFHSNVYTCLSHPMSAKQIAKYADIQDVSAVYKELRSLVQTRMLAKIATPRGILQYKFLLHTPKKKRDKV